MRVLVTGSRDWADVQAVHNELYRAFVAGCRTLVHGHCPTGADAIADQIWSTYANKDGVIERYPADWSFGPSAGPVRNAAMVALGADLCLAFIGPCTSPRCTRADPHDSHGASGCADLAEAADIPTRRIRATTPAAPERGETKGAGE